MSETRMLLDDFKRARAVTLTQLIQHFLTPGMPDAEVADAKQQNVLDQKSDTARSSLSRNDAFSQLLYRVRVEPADNNAADLIALIQKIKSKWSWKRTSYENVILGLAYRYGFGGLAKNKKFAFDLLKSASDSDEKNGYAHALLGYAYAFGDNPNTKDALVCLNKAITKAPATAGVAHTVKGLIYEACQDTQAGAVDEFRQAAKLNDVIGLRKYAEILSKNQDKPQGKECLKAAIVRGSALALSDFAAFHLDKQKSEDIGECHVLAAQYSPEAIAYDNVGTYYSSGNHCNADDKNYVIAAAYYRCALAIGLKNEQPGVKSFLRSCLKSRQEVALGVIRIIDFDAIYHAALALNNTDKLAYILEKAPEVFVRLWKEDYNKPLHAKMKEQAIAFVLTLNPNGLSVEANSLLAKTLLDGCTEPKLKAKAVEFSIAQMDKASAAAVPALTAVKASAVKPKPVAVADPAQALKI